MGRRGGAWDAPEYRIDASQHDNPAMDALDGKMDIIHASSLFHLFGWETQKKAGIRMVKLLKKDDPAVMIFGRHVGVSRARNMSAASDDVAGTQTRTSSTSRSSSPASKTDDIPTTTATTTTTTTTTTAESSDEQSSSKDSTTPASSRPGSKDSSTSLPSTGNGSSTSVGIGTTTPVTAGMTMQGGDKRFLHDARSWQKLWDEVGEATGTRWRTEVDWLGPPIQSMVDSSGAAVRRMRFAVFRSC